MGARLADIAWPDAEALAAGAVLAVPIGATEQHGPHLPMSTDTDIAVALVDGLTTTRSHVLAAPAVAYGSSGEHSGFAGTLSIGQEAIERLIVELVRSASASFERVLLVSTHGGNRTPVGRAERLLLGEGRNVTTWSPGWPGDAHAGRTETSLMLAIAPARVRLGRASAGATAPIGALLASLMEHGVRAVSRNGVLGDPAGASALEGRALLADAVAQLVELVDDGRAAG